MRLCAWSNRVDELFAWLRSHDLTSRTRLQQIEALRYREESAWTKLAILARSVAPETWQVRRKDADRAMRELEEAWRCVAPRLALEEGWDEGRWL